MNTDMLKGKIRIVLAAMIIIAVVMTAYDFARSNFQNAIIKNIDITDKLEIEKPKYVNFEDIKTGDYSFERDDASSYSQIEIKNISDETLYEISIDLAEQETTTKNSFFVPSYHISILKSGESAILSAQHENVKSDQALKVESESYRDSQGNAIIVSGEFDKSEDRNIEVEPNIKVEFVKISDEASKIHTGEILVSKEPGQQIVEIEVKNVSKDKLYDVYVDFLEYHDGKVVGNIYGRLEVLDEDFTRTIKIKTIPDTELKISDIGYRLTAADDPKGRVFSIYPDEGVYKVGAYQSIAKPQTKNKSMTFARLAAIIIFLEANRREAEYRIKGLSEGKDEYIKKSVYAGVIKWVTLIVYIALVADLFVR